MYIKTVMLEKAKIDVYSHHMSSTLMSTSVNKHMHAERLRCRPKHKRKRDKNISFYLPEYVSFQHTSYNMTTTVSGSTIEGGGVERRYPLLR